MEHENELRRNNQNISVLTENTTEFRIIYMTLHLFLVNIIFVNEILNENKMDDVMLNIKYLIPNINQSEKYRLIEFLNQEESYKFSLKLFPGESNVENRFTFPEIVKQKLIMFKYDFISVINTSIE